MCVICISSLPGATHVAVRQYHDQFLWRCLARDWWKCHGWCCPLYSPCQCDFSWHKSNSNGRDQVVSPFTVPGLQARTVPMYETVFVLQGLFSHVPLRNSLQNQVLVINETGLPGQPFSFCSDAVWPTMLSLFPLVSFGFPNAEGRNFNTVKGSKDLERDDEQHFCHWLPSSFQVRSPIAEVTHPEWGVNGYTIGRTGNWEGQHGRFGWSILHTCGALRSWVAKSEMRRHDAWQLWLLWGVNGRYGSQFSPKCNDMHIHPFPSCSFAPSCPSMWSCLFSGLVQLFFAGAIWDTTFEPKPLAGVPLALSHPNGQQVMKSSNDAIEDNRGLSCEVLRHSSANLHQCTLGDTLGLKDPMERC